MITQSTTHTTPRTWGLPLALGAAVSFGVSGPLAKTLTEAGWSTSAVVITRLGIAAVVAGCIAQWSEPDWWRSVWRHRGSVGLYGVISMAVSQFCFFSAAQHMSVGVALMMEYLSPVAVISWMWITTKVRPSRAVLTGATIALSGAFIVLGVFTGAHIDGVGLLWSLGAASAGAAYFILGARFSDEVSTFALAAGGLVIGTASVACAAALGVFPIAKGAETVQMAGSTTGALVPLVALGCATGIAYPVGVTAISRLSPTVASILGLLEIPIAVAVAWLLLGESLTVSQYVGATILLSGVALTQRKGSPAEGLAVNEPPVMMTTASPDSAEEDGKPLSVTGITNASDQEFLFTSP